MKKIKRPSTKKSKQAFFIWITGLAGSGKTTIGEKLHAALKRKFANTVFLDGDVFREVFRAGGYTREERFVIARQIVALCGFLVKQNINVVCATISLFKEIQDYNRKKFKNYFEIYLKCPLHELQKRDKKNLYSRAMKGQIKNVVGIDLSFDEPKNCELCIDTGKNHDIDQIVGRILKLFLRSRI